MEDVPIIIGNEKFKTKDVRYQVMVRQYFSLIVYPMYLIIIIYTIIITSKNCNTNKYIYFK